MTAQPPAAAHTPGRSWRTTRRAFLFTGAGLLAAGGGVAGYYYGRRPVKLGLVGAGTQGKTLARNVAKSWWFGDVHSQIVAVCDVDREHAEGLRAECCPEAALYGDHRQLLARDDVEAVLVATPDHWHAAIAVDALRAGKHVYCEKPISLTVAEGQLLCRVVRETGRVFAGGTLQRSDRKFRVAGELVLNGRVGTLHTVTLTLPQRWKAEFDGPFPTSAPPAHLDWDRWLGQAPLADYCPQRCHGSFRRWYEYSGGQMVDWGAHHLDIVQWVLGMDASGPLTAEGAAKFPGVAGGFNTPIEFTAELTYADGVRVRVRTEPDLQKNGIRFEGDGGDVFVNRNRLEGSAVEAMAKHPLGWGAKTLHARAAARWNHLTWHLIDFLRCTRTGETPISDVVSQHRSASACHVANIALRLGRKLTWDPEAETFVGDDEANAMLRRTPRAGYELPS